MGDADDPAACWSGRMSTDTILHNGSAADVAVSGRKRPRNGRVEHPTSAQRSATGKAARAAVPRSSHAAWEPAPGRRDPVDVLEEQAQTRVLELVPIRYGRMLVSPFTFYRGAAALMAADLAGAPRTGLHVQLCGDAHLAHFGVVAAPDRRLVFGLNDFDCTRRARWSVSAASGHARDRADARQRRRRPTVPAVQGGRALGARAVPRHTSEFANHRQRVVEGQRPMQSASEIMLAGCARPASTASSV